MLTAVYKREEIRGVQIFTRTVGAGPDVAVLHGGPGAHHDYLLPQYDALAAGRCLRYYDQRGGGQSPVGRETPVDWREQVADLEALRVRWRLDRLTILGYSWGGLLALLYATVHPDRVERLALIAPASINRPLRDAFETRFAERMAAPELTAQRQALQDSGLRDRDLGAYRERAFELSVWGYFADPMRARDLTPFRVTERTRKAVWESLGDVDLAPGLAAVRVPTLIVHGREDPIPVRSSESLAEVLDAELVILEETGHAPHVEAFEKFVSAVDGFLPRA